MTPHLLDLEKCVPLEGNLFVLVIPFYYYTIIYRYNIPLHRYNIPLYHLYRYTLPNYTVLGCLTCGGKGHPLGFWCDANFAARRDTLRSTTGWVVTMYGGAVSWSSKKQATAAASTMDAEYQACGAAAREGMSLRKALGEMALLSSDFLLGGRVIRRCDSKAALSLCKDCKEGQRVKHIDVIHHFARDHVASGELSFVYCKSEENVSD
jgi:hypothetical protein